MEQDEFKGLFKKKKKGSRIISVLPAHATALSSCVFEYTSLCILNTVDTIYIILYTVIYKIYTCNLVYVDKRGTY